MRPKYLNSYSDLLIMTGVMVFLLFMYSFQYSLEMMVKLICGAIFILLMFATRYCGYPELTDTELVCRNAIYRFWSRHYRYEDIDKVVYCRVAGTVLLVYLKGNKRRRGHSMSCMAGKDVDDFIAELRSKGVTVERPTTLRGQW